MGNIEYGDVTIFKTRPMQHQEEAFNWARSITNVALFFEMSLGKSKTAIDMAAWRYKDRDLIDSVLVIAPNLVHKQWAMEQIPEHCGCDYRVGIYGGKRSKKEQNEWKKVFTIDDKTKLTWLCVNVDSFSRGDKYKIFSSYVENHRTMIILDEAMVIKTIDSNRTKNILYGFSNCIWCGRQLQKATTFASFKMILTGTPVTNSPLDAYAPMEFLNHNFWNMGYFQFKQYFTVTIRPEFGRARVIIDERTYMAVRRKNCWADAFEAFGISEEDYRHVMSHDTFTPYKRIDELKNKLHKVGIFKLKKDCLDLPPRRYIVKKIDMSDEQERIYNDLKQDLLAQYGNKILTIPTKLALYTRLQQVACGFMPVSYELDEKECLQEEIEERDIIIPPVEIGGDNNKRIMLETDLATARFPIIITTKYTAECRILVEKLDTLKQYKIGIMTGTIKRPVNVLQDFKDGKLDILVANIACIARGLNLQMASTMMFYSNTFSLDLRLQVEDRIHRPGQKNECTYIDYIYRKTIEQHIYDVLKERKTLLNYLREVKSDEVLR